MPRRRGTIGPPAPHRTTSGTLASTLARSTAGGARGRWLPSDASSAAKVCPRAEGPIQTRWRACGNDPGSRRRLRRSARPRSPTRPRAPRCHPSVSHKSRVPMREPRKARRRRRRPRRPSIATAPTDTPGGRKPPRLRSPVKRRESPGPTRRTPPPSHDRKRRRLRASPRPPPSPSPRSRWSAPSYPAPCWPPGACAADAANWSRPRQRPSTPGFGTASRLHRPACRARHPWVCALHGRRPRTTSPSFPNRGRRWPTRAR
ncbi:hypothetical protein AU375_02638 [Methylobacterium radiotolerans]|nr:hypothetical protein AU375_02638 [Methylobacterium radiotolerans]